MENEQTPMENEQSLIEEGSITTPDYSMPSEKKQTDLTTVTIRLKKGLLKDYTALCKLKRTDRSKRLRNFMIYELKKNDILSHPKGWSI